MTTPRVVARITPAEHPRVLEVWEASVRATHDFVREEDIRVFRNMLRDVIPRLQNLLGARDDRGVLIGFISVSDHNLDMLFIHPDARGQGVGRHLLLHAVEWLGVTTLDVNEQNAQALGFYLRMGFEVVGRSEMDGTGKPYPLLHMRLAAATPDKAS